ncbi:MAG: D-aminoacyl-tRNA deacylase [Patescibacteria group bacterium]|nr:D-aminoacyl-tRNA deacylase [Patescibacteria group bacterium]MDD5554801.1 D-aminoacyl-tRNA deacylase [Patescibacteria group bacterium]
MRAVIQRAKEAEVKVGGKIIGKISKGLLVLLAIHQDDTEDKIEKLATKIINLRIFADKADKMNLSVKDVKGEILVVSQFTLYGDTSKGNRPSFIESAKPEKAVPYYEKFVEKIKNNGIKTETGEFGAMMEVSLINDGPVTIIIDT